jgi:hypothetical protein
MTEANRDFAVEEHATVNGKEIGVYKVAGTSLYCIAFKSGGEIPADLQGKWTEPRAAERAIVGYLMKQEVAAQQKAEKKSAPKKTKKVETEPPVNIFAEPVEEENGLSETE